MVKHGLELIYNPDEFRLLCGKCVRMSLLEALLEKTGKSEASRAHRRRAP